ncbi:MAG TPA: TonB-dependent receptor, partial [Mucilaginibacter sp.]
QVIMGDKLFKSCARLSDCLLGKIFGVSFDADGNPINDRSRKKMSVIINGNIIPGDALNSVNVNDVYSIEVLRGQSYTLIYGSGMSAGALVITTNHGVGNFVTSESPSGLISYPFKGYYKARVFYSPKYSTPKPNNKTLDLCSTIYWNPNIITDEKGQTSFDYFNADTKGTYRIVIEGIDGFGNLGRQVYRYKVE